MRRHSVIYRFITIITRLVFQVLMWLTTIKISDGAEACGKHAALDGAVGQKHGDACNEPRDGVDDEQHFKAVVDGADEIDP